MRKIGIFLATFLIFTGALVLSNRINKPVDPPGVNSPPPGKVNPQPQISATIQEALGAIDKTELKTILYWLTSIDLEGRMSAKKGNDTACDYLTKYYRGLGYDVSTQEFSVNNVNNFKEQGTGKTANVIATLPGNDPVLSGETVIIGAHFDHIGYGPSMSRAPQRREIHPGADDNASGTTALMGAAKAIAKMKGKNKRRIVFISFSAEEMGLIGSKHYVNNPKYPNTVFMVNMDMVGRYNTGGLSCFGASNSRKLSNFISSELTNHGLKAKFTTEVGGGSDHAPFAQKNIPVIFLHTSLHSEYHTPDDTPDRIDYESLASISKIVTGVVWYVSQNGCKDYNKKVRFQVDEVFQDHDVK